MHNLLQKVFPGIFQVIISNGMVVVKRTATMIKRKTMMVMAMVMTYDRRWTMDDG